MQVGKYLGLVVVGLLLCSGRVEAACTGGPTVWQAAANTRAAWVECLALVGDGDTINVPAGTATDWTTNLSVNNLCISIIGAGIGSSIIQNSVANKNNTPVLSIGTKVCSGSDVMRLSGFEFVSGSGGGAGTSTHVGTIQVSGATTSFRMDHNKFNPVQQMAWNISGYVRGVVDHNVCNHTSSLFCAQDNMERWLGDGANCTGFNGSGCGDRSWASPLPHRVGTEGNTDQLFYEDNALISTNNQSFHDCSGGMRSVFRFNVQTNSSWNQHDEARGGRGSRACLNFEAYRNLLISDISTGACCGAWTFAGGTGMVWQNDHERRGGFSGWSFVSQMQDYRRAESAAQPRDHYVFGSVGKWPITSITCSGGTATATVTNTAGMTNRHSLTLNAAANVYRVIIESSSVTNYNSATNPNSVGGLTPVLTVPTQSTFTFAATCNGTGTGATIKQPFDENRDSTGYRAMSQPGAGPSVYPDMVSGAPASNNQSFNYAVQSLMPIYVWGNRRDSTAASGTPTYAASGMTCDGLCNTGGIIIRNRDYYDNVTSASCTAGGACTSGVGSGTTLPTSCTAGTAGAAGEGGVFFWKTNEGSWNNESAADHANHLDSAGNSSHTLGEDGQGYRCTATDTWTLDYIPADYPHFLITGAAPPSNTSPVVTIATPSDNNDTTATTIDFGGNCVDDAACTSTTIANTLTAFSGATTTGPTPWTHSALALDLGINPVTVTGSDGSLTGTATRNVFRDDCGSGFPYSNTFSLYADGTAWPTLGPCMGQIGSGLPYAIVGNKAVSTQDGFSACTVYNGQTANADQSVSVTMGQIGAGQQVRLAVRASGSAGSDADKFALLYNVSPSFIWLGRYNGATGLDLFYATWSGQYTPVANVTTARLQVQGTVAHVFLDVDGVGAGAEVELDDAVGSPGSGINISSFANSNGKPGVCLIGANTSFDSLVIDNVTPPPSDTTPPVVTIDEPLEGFGTTETTFPAAGLNGTVTDGGSGPASCQYQNNVNPGYVSLTLAAGDWENAASIPLALGQNTLSVRCYDVDGNFHEVSVSVTRSEPPIQTRPARRLRLRF